MKLSLKKSILLTLVILQCTQLTYSQSSDAQPDTQQTSNVPAVTSAPVAETLSGPAPATTTTEAPQTATTTEAPQTATTTEAPQTTTTQAPQTTTTQAPETTADATVVPTTRATTTSDAAAPDPTSSSDAGNSTPTQRKEEPQQSTITVTRNGSAVPTVITPSDRPQATESGAANNQGENASGSSKTAIIAGSVVGGLVGIALIAGLLTWMNRRGGCTSRTHRRDIQEDFSNDNDYKMTENNAAGSGATGAMQPSDSLPPSSPFQNARRFVPPTSNPTGYMNLQDEEYGYHQNAVVDVGYQAQQYQDYQHYNEYAAHDGSVTGSNHGAYPPQAFYSHAPGSNVTSPTLVNSVQQLKPDQVEQKPNVA